MPPAQRLFDAPCAVTGCAKAPPKLADGQGGGEIDIAHHRSAETVVVVCELGESEVIYENLRGGKSSA